MAKIKNAEEMSKYSVGGFFSLKNDKDTKRVRIMYNSADDIEGMAVHKVKFQNGSFKYVDCLRTYDEPLDNCPLCKSGNRAIIKFFVPIYDPETDTVLTWERGKTYYPTLVDICNQNAPIVSKIVEIERNGEAGDMNTTYEFYFDEDDGTELGDLPEIPDVYETNVMLKTVDEMNRFLMTGSFDENTNGYSNNGSDVVERRRRYEPDNSDGFARRRSGIHDNFS